MRFNFLGKNYQISDAFKKRFETKIGRMQKLLPPDAEVHVTISVVKNAHTMEVTIPLRKRILRAEVTSDDVFAAIDEMADILEKQMVKYKGRVRDRSRRDHSFKEELAYIAPHEEASEQTENFAIDKIKRFALKPMDAEEAVMEMEMLGHNFYVFRSTATDEINVVYRRRNNTYGLIEPEY